MRGRKPTPTHLRLLQGNPANRPVNANEPRPPRPPDIPPAPSILTPEAREEWNRVAEEVYNLGLLTVVDVQVLAAYCQAYGRWARAERKLAKVAELDDRTEGLIIKSANGNFIPNPLIWIATSAARDMVRYAAEFGFTPSSRTRIAVGRAVETASKFGGLLG